MSAEALAKAAAAYRAAPMQSVADMSLVVEVGRFSFSCPVLFSCSSVQHLSDELIRAASERERQRVPLASHGLVETEGRKDAVHMLLEQEVLQRRDTHLLPLRHGRMAFSPFTFYRGAARIFAHDLIRVPQSGINHIWICGDAHLCNFGMFASRERVLVFDINGECLQFSSVVFLFFWGLI